jgi:hypothetical protein
MSRLPWLLGAILPLVARAPKSSWLPSGAGEGEGVSPAWLSGIAATAAAVAVGGGVAAVALTQRPIVPAKRKESFLSDAAGIAKARCTSWFQPPAWEAASTSEDEEDSDACVPCHHDSDFEEDPDDEDGLELAGAPHSTGAQTAPPAAQPSPSSLPSSRAHQMAHQPKVSPPTPSARGESPLETSWRRRCGAPPSGLSRLIGWAVVWAAAAVAHAATGGRRVAGPRRRGGSSGERDRGRRGRGTARPTSPFEQVGHLG